MPRPHGRPSTRASSLLLPATFSLALAAGCKVESSAPAPVEALTRAVEASQAGPGKVYDLAFKPSPPTSSGELIERAIDRLTQHSFPIHATGALLAPFTDKGVPLMNGNTRIRGSCGITFISPSFAITSGHCVNSNDTDLNDLSVEMFRPTLALIDNWQKVKTVSGQFPSWSHGFLSTSDGYLKDTYRCQVVESCFRGKPEICSDPILNQGADIALLRCDGRPGDKYGYLNIAQTATQGATVFLPWKHEIIDIPASAYASNNPLPDLRNHYVLRHAFPDNFHYFGNASLTITGFFGGKITLPIARNQILPLRSTNWSNGAPHVTVGSQAFVPNVDDNSPRTDLLGCHGTSGSGILQKNSTTNTWELLGPAHTGSTWLGTSPTHLCDNLDQNPVSPGSFGITYSHVAFSQRLFDKHRTQLADDCRMPVTNIRAAINNIFRCPAFEVNGQFGVATPPSGNDPWKSPLGAVVDSQSTTGVTILPLHIEAGKTYRFSLTAFIPNACDWDPEVNGCPTITADLNGFQVLNDGPHQSGQLTALSATFVAPSTADATLTLKATQGIIQVGDISMVADGAVNTFDSIHQRLEAALFTSNGTTPFSLGPLPMRFQGDGGDGFAAVLYPGERMVLGQEAMLARRKWALRFAASSYATLSCGLVDVAGQVVARITPCDASALATIDDRTGTGEATGFFVEAAAGPGGPILIDDVGVVTSSAPDGDGDGVPDAVDNCPVVPNPDQAPRPPVISAASTVNAYVCAWDAQPVTLTAPTATDCNSSPVAVSGEIISVNGQAAGDPRLAVAAGTQNLPPATYVVRWSAVDAKGSRATRDQTVNVKQRFSITQNVYDGPEWWGTMTFKNNGPTSVSAYKVEFNVAPGVHCTNDYLPTGAILSPLVGSGPSAQTPSNHCVFTWASGPPIGAGASKTFNYSTDSQTCAAPTEVSANETSCVCVAESTTSFCSRLQKNCGAASDLDNCRISRSVSSCGSCSGIETCGGGGTPGLCGGTGLAITQNVYNGPQWWGTITFKNNNSFSVTTGYRVEFDVPNGVHCTADEDAVPPGAVLTPLTGSGLAAYTTKNHCVFTWANPGALAPTQTVTFHYSTDSQNFSAASNLTANILELSPL